MNRSNNGSGWTAPVAAAMTVVLSAVTLLGCASPGGNRGVKPSRTVSLGEFAEPSQQSRTRPTLSELEALNGTAAEREAARFEQVSNESGVTIADDTPLPRRLGAGDSEAARELIDERSEDHGDAGGATTGDGAASGQGNDAAAGSTNGAITRITPGEEMIVDSLIGQVNGRPIFADEFFEPIEAQLRAASRRMNTRDFAQTAVQVVSMRLLEVVQNELVLAEAEAGLSQDERRGIFAFMRFLQEEVIAKEGSGSRSGTEQRLLEEQGVTLEEYLELEKNKALISKLIFEKIRPRVIVSWRDIEREYERRIDQYQPPATVVLSRIRLATESRADEIEQVKQRLIDGEDFKDVAEAYGFEEGGEWIEVEMGPNGVDDMKLNPEIREQLRGMELGFTSDPFPVGSSTWWLHVKDIRQPPQKSIYDQDVQRELTRFLYNQRFREQHDRYIQSLLDRGIFDELDEMRSRLVTIAMVRYAP